MSFGSDDEPKSDKLLMFSMLGIVLVTGLAFGLSFLTRKQPLPSVQPAAPPVVQQKDPAPATQVDTGRPSPVPFTPEPDPVRIPPPVQVELQAPPVSNPPAKSNYTHGTGNRKLDGLRDVTEVN